MGVYDLNTKDLLTVNPVDDKSKRKSKRKSARKEDDPKQRRRSKRETVFLNEKQPSNVVITEADELPDAKLVFSSDEEEKKARRKKLVDNTGYTSPTSKRKIEKIEKDPTLSKYFTKK